MIRVCLLTSLALLCAVHGTVAGPFENPGIPQSEIRVWANQVVDFQPTSSGSDTELAVNALGRPDSTFVSLGDLDEAQIAASSNPGSITLSLPYAITNGDGWDFAVFENAGLFFTEPFIFAELARLEVSSNGTDFVGFPTTSLNVEPGAGNADTELTADFGRDFSGLNTTNVSNLAGIHPAGTGTGFDLSDLTDIAASADLDLDLDSIAYVRIVDIPGDGSFLDSEGRGILDAWPSTEPSGGFDLDALGTRYPVPEPNGVYPFLIGIVALLVCKGWRRRR